MQQRKNKDTELKEIEMFSKMFTPSFTSMVHKITGADLIKNPLYSNNLEAWKKENNGELPDPKGRFKVNVPGPEVNHRRRMIKAWKSRGRIGYLEYLAQFVKEGHELYPKLMENIEQERKIKK